MAIVTLNRVFKGCRGRVGDIVFRQCGRQTVLARRPEPSRLPPTPAQLANRARFAAAARERSQQAQQKKNETK